MRGYLHKPLDAYSLLSGMNACGYTLGKFEYTIRSAGLD